jgi:H+/Cl- antiporter ClcA
MLSEDERIRMASKRRRGVRAIWIFGAIVFGLVILLFAIGECRYWH